MGMGLGDEDVGVGGAGDGDGNGGGDGDGDGDGGVLHLDGHEALGPRALPRVALVHDHGQAVYVHLEARQHNIRLHGRRSEMISPDGIIAGGSPNLADHALLLPGPI